MTTKKLPVALFAVASLCGTDVALADVGAAAKTMIFGSSSKDLARVNTNVTPARLRRTRNEQPGAEQSAVAMFTDPDGRQTHGIYFERRSGVINGQLPQNDVQGAMVGFKLVQDATTGAVSAQLDPTIPAQFLTTHRGSEDRTFNQPNAYPINNGTAIVIEYNWRPNNRTYRYAQVIGANGAKLMPETKVYEKNNDDCSMNQDGHMGVVASFDATTNTSHVVNWRGCNGNGADNGWMVSESYTCDSATNPTSCTWKQAFDVTLCEREERSRGACSVGTDPNTAICTWTEGNNQPQRDGTWVAAVDITPGKFKGTDQQNAILWKQMVDGRKDADPTTGTPTTYSQRAQHERIMLPDTTGKLQPSDLIIWRSGDARGNNTQDRKGGTYYRMNMAVMRVTKSGMTYVVPMQDMQQTTRGLDGTHLGISYGVFGTTDALKPGIMFVGGSHNGGGAGAQVTALTYDTTTLKFSKLGDYTIAPYDRHLYPNWLGQNPGEQGRNFSASMIVPNPYVGMNGSKDAHLAIFTTTGKDSTEVATATNNDQCKPSMEPTATPVPCAALKLSSYISVLPIAQQPTSGTGTGSGSGSGSGSGTGMGTGSGSGSGSGSATGSDATGSDATATDPGATLGGCSAGGGAGGASLLIIGLAAVLRRRRA